MLIMGTLATDKTRILLEVMCVEYEPTDNCMCLFDTSGDEWIVHNVDEVEGDGIFIELYQEGQHYFDSYQLIELLDDDE